MSKIEVQNDLLASMLEINETSYDEDSLLTIENAKAQENICPKSKIDLADSDRAQIHLATGLTSRSKQNWHDTIEICKQALNFNPNLIAAYNALGNAFQEMGQITEAIESYATALAIEPDCAEIYHNLGSLYARQQQWQASIKYYQQAIKLNPNCTEAYFKLATIWHQLGHSAKVKQMLARIEQLDCIELISGEECFVKGRQLQQQNELVTALFFYERGIKLVPNCLFIYQQLVIISEQLEQWEKATLYARQILHLQQFSEDSLESDFQPVSLEQKIQSLQEEPESAQQQTSLASLSAGQQQWELAIAYYQKAIALNPDLANAYRDLARILTVFAEPESTTQYWLRAFELDATGMRAGEYLQLGHQLLEREQLEQALFCYRRARQLQPDIAESFICLGEVLEILQESQQALSCYRQGIERHPHNYRLHNRLAKFFTAQKDWSSAIAAYQTTLELNPHLSWSYYHLGDCYLNQNQWSSAMSAYQSFIELQSNFVDVYPQLALALDNVAFTLECESPESSIQEAIESYYREIALNADSFCVECQTLELQSNNYQLCCELGDRYEELGKWAKAIAFYRIALAIKPQQPQICFKLGKILERQDYVAEAIIYYGLACDLDESESLYRDCLQKVLIK